MNTAQQAPPPLHRDQDIVKCTDMHITEESTLGESSSTNVYQSTPTTHPSSPNADHESMDISISTASTVTTRQEYTSDTRLECVVCKERSSVEKFAHLDGSAPLVGDVKIVFTCSSCSATGKEEFDWPLRRSWVEIGFLAFLNLAAQNEGYPVPQNGQFYHLQTQVYAFVYNHFNTLCAGHARNCWKSNLAIALGCLPSHFEHSDGQQGKGWWRIRYDSVYPTPEDVGAAGKTLHQSQCAGERKPSETLQASWRRTPSARKPSSEPLEPTPRKTTSQRTNSSGYRAPAARGSTPARMSSDRSQPASSRPSWSSSSHSDEESVPNTEFAPSTPQNRVKRVKSALHKVHSVPMIRPSRPPLQPCTIDSPSFKQAIDEAMAAELGPGARGCDQQAPQDVHLLQEELKHLDTASTDAKKFVCNMLRSQRPAKVTADLLREYRAQYDTGMLLSALEAPGPQTEGQRLPYVHPRSTRDSSGSVQVPSMSTFPLPPASFPFASTANIFSGFLPAHLPPMQSINFHGPIPDSSHHLRSSAEQAWAPAASSPAGFDAALRPLWLGPPTLFNGGVDQRLTHSHVVSPTPVHANRVFAKRPHVSSGSDSPSLAPSKRNYSS